MAAWGTVARKELKENLRDWRVIMPALIIGPIFSPLLLGAMISFLLQQAVDKAEEDLELPVVGAELAPNLMAFLAAHRVVVTPGPEDRAAAIEAVTERAHEVVLLIAPGIAASMAEGQTATVELVMDRARRTSTTDAERATALIGAYSQQLGSLRLLARGIDPQIVRPLHVDRLDVSTPSARSVLLLSFLTYILLFAVLMGGLPITNDMTAGERERKSLEPLLTTPISRTQLVLEKILAAAVFMVIALTLCLTVLSLGLRQLPLEQIGMQSNLGAREGALAFLILLPFVPFGAGLMSVVASFTKTYKEAQTYLGVLVMAPTLPIMFAGVADLKPELSLMFVPSLSQHFLLLSLLKAEPIPAAHVIASAGGTLLVAVIAIAAAVRLYQREGLLG